MTLPPEFPPPRSRGDDPLRHHRRASVILFVVGGLLVVMGLCNFISSVLATEEMLRAQLNTKLFGADSNVLNLTPAGLRNLAAVMAMVTLAVGATLAILGGAVRSGSRPAVVTAIVVVALFMLIIGLFTLGAAVAGLSDPTAFLCACGMAIPLALLITLLIWLILAAVAGNRVARAKAQQAALFMQSQRAAGQFGRTVGAYGYAPPPNAPPASAPSSNVKEQSDGPPTPG